MSEENKKVTDWEHIIDDFIISFPPEEIPRLNKFKNDYKNMNVDTLKNLSKSKFKKEQEKIAENFGTSIDSLDNEDPQTELYLVFLLLKHEKFKREHALRQQQRATN